MTQDAPEPEVNETPDVEAADVPDVDESAKDPLAEAQAEIAALQDKLTRARADYVNLEKRQAREAALERERVKARVLEGFLQVYEYGKMAEFEAERNPGPLAEGVKMIVGAFDRLLEGEGVVSIGKIGDAFDATRHEAFATEAGEGVEAGHVSRVIQPGYALHDRVLRYAKVAVAPDEEE